MPTGLAALLAVGSVALAVMCGMRLFSTAKNRRKVAFGIALGGVVLIPVGLFKGNSGIHILILAIDVMLSLCFIFLAIQKDTREYEARQVRGETDIPSLSPAKARWIVFGWLVLFAALLTLEYLPFW